MIRRIHIPGLRVGEFILPPLQAHHLRDVLRLGVGDAAEAFDDAGASGEAVIVAVSQREVVVRVAEVHPPRAGGFVWTVAAAVPKGPRADWMVEKLSELGTASFIPLVAERSVAIPGGKEKLNRWTRLAEEAARQSGRAGVMRIEPLTPLPQALAGGADARWYFSTKPDAEPIGRLLAQPPPASLMMLIGPEGGWTDNELGLFQAAEVGAVKLTNTTLRVETAAIAAAAIVAAMWGA